MKTVTATPEAPKKKVDLSVIKALVRINAMFSMEENRLMINEFYTKGIVNLEDYIDLTFYMIDQNLKQKYGKYYD